MSFQLPPSYEESQSIQAPMSNPPSISRWTTSIEKNLLDIQRRLEQLKPCRYCQSTQHQTRQHYSPHTHNKES